MALSRVVGSWIHPKIVDEIVGGLLVRLSNTARHVEDFSGAFGLIVRLPIGVTLQTQIQEIS